jgi:hypothetical protein
MAIDEAPYSTMENAGFGWPILENGFRQLTIELQFELCESQYCNRNLDGPGAS